MVFGNVAGTWSRSFACFYGPGEGGDDMRIDSRFQLSSDKGVPQGVVSQPLTNFSFQAIKAAFDRTGRPGISIPIEEQGPGWVLLFGKPLNDFQTSVGWDIDGSS